MKRLLLVLLFNASLPVFGYDFVDMYRDIAPSHDASMAVLSALNSFNTVQIDSDVEGFLDVLANSTDTYSLYLGDLYRSEYFRPIDNDYRALTLKHVRNPGSNQIMIIPETYDDLDISRSKDYCSIREIGIKANAIATVKKYRSYSFYYKFKSSWENAGELKPADMGDGLLKIVAPSNIREMKIRPSPLHNNLKNETRVLMDAFSNTLPHSSGLIDHYIELNDFIRIEENKKSLVSYTHVIFQPRIKSRVFNNEYPELAKYIDKYKKRITTRLTLKNKSGNTYFILNVSPKKTFFECYTYQGKVIPVGKNGHLVFEEAGSFENEKEIVGEVDLKIDLLGLDILANGIAVVENRITPQKDSLRARAEKITCEYSGMLLGFIPISVVRFLAPIDIDKFAEDMIAIMLQGNNGEGTVVAFEWEKNQSGNRFSNVQISGEMLDNFMLEFALKLMQNSFGARDMDSIIEQVHDVGKKVLSAVMLDSKSVFASLEYSGDGLVQMRELP